MTESSNTPPQHRNALSARRLTLLGSVAGLGLAVLVAGPTRLSAGECPGMDSVRARGSRRRAITYRFCRYRRQGKARRDFGPRQGRRVREDDEHESERR